MDVAMVYLEVDAQGLEPEDVHVDLAGADVATAGHGYDSLAKAGEQRAEDGCRGAHLRDEVIGRLPLGDLGRVND